MPYIKNDGRREALRNGESAQTAGELNYQIFYHIKHNNYTESLIGEFIEQFLTEKPNYQRYNDMTGALIRCYVEIKRRLKLECDFLILIAASYNDEIAKYEELKVIENGDVE